jgi:glycerophosphoryl diester phosphodiesterase
MRIAHRGLAGLYPENTLLSFEKCLDYHPDAIELDVQLTTDGAVVVHHDEEFGRTTDAKGYVKDYTLSELKRFSASYTRPDLPRQEIPTLAEYFDLIAGTPLPTFIELKNSFVPYPGLEEKVLEIIDRYEPSENGSHLFGEPLLVMKIQGDRAGYSGRFPIRQLDLRLRRLLRTIAASR